MMKNKKIKLTKIFILFICLFCVFGCTKESEDNKNISLYKNDINSLPSVFEQLNIEFVFTNENLNKKFNINSNNIVVGIFKYDIIYIDSNYYDKSILFHELSHAFDKYYNHLSQQEDFSKLFNKYKKKETLINSEEFFADSFSAFLLDKKNFEKNHHDLYQYFNNKTGQSIKNML